MTNSKSILNLLLCATACLIAAGFGGMFSPGEWYTHIKIAPWSPPNIAFPIVWSILYVFIAIAGWRIFTHGTFQLKALWGGQLILNALWSWVFFGQHWVFAGLVDIALIMILVIILIAKCWSFDNSTKSLRVCSYLLAPYLVWLIIAGSLNLYILVAN